MDNPDTAVGVRASQRYQAVTPVGNSNRMPSRRMYSKQPLCCTRFKYQQALFIIKVPSSPSPLTKGLSGSFLQSFLSCFSLSTAIPLIAKRTFALEVSLAGSPKRTFALDLALFPKTERERSFLSWSQHQHKTRKEPSFSLRRWFPGPDVAVVETENRPPVIFQNRELIGGTDGGTDLGGGVSYIYYILEYYDTHAPQAVTDSPFLCFFLDYP